MVVLIVILIFVAIFAVYATVATNVLTVRKDTVSFSALPESANGLKIVLISDLHDRDMNRRLANKIKEQKPDMIVVCGDVHNRERKRVPFFRLAKGFAAYVPSFLFGAITTRLSATLFSITGCGSSAFTFSKTLPKSFAG